MRLLNRLNVRDAKLKRLKDCVSKPKKTLSVRDWRLKKQNVRHAKLLNRLSANAKKLRKQSDYASRLKLMLSESD